MTTLPTTSSSESRFQEAVLSVLHAQWRALGVPFTSALPHTPPEVIDPEALLWCSLEFIEREPRLAEGVAAWVRSARTRIIGQRITQLIRASGEDPREERWRLLLSARRDPEARRDGLRAWPGRKRIGVQAADCSTLLLRARDILGCDCRSFLIVFLLASERGVRLRDVTRWTGYSYRSVSEAASGWERAGVVRIDHGHCVLTAPAPWSELLLCARQDIVIVDWPAAYQASIELLRTFAKAREGGLSAAHPLAVSAIDATRTALSVAAGGTAPSRTPTLSSLAAALAA